MTSKDEDIWKKLSNLKELQKKGLISTTEFENRKLQLIDNMTGTKLISTNKEREKEKLEKIDKLFDKYEKLEKKSEKSDKIISDKMILPDCTSNSSKKNIKCDSDFKPITTAGNDLAVPLLDSLKQLNNGYASCTTLSRGSAGSPLEISPSVTITNILGSLHSIHSIPYSIPPPAPVTPSQTYIQGSEQPPNSSIPLTISSLELSESSKSSLKKSNSHYLNDPILMQESFQNSVKTKISLVPHQSSQPQISGGLRTSDESKGLIPRPPPSWSDISLERAVCHFFNFKSSKWVQQTITVKIDRDPFARGSLRYAYYMLDLSKEKENGIMHVAKVSIDPFEERESYFQDVVMQIYAKQFAISYNSYCPPKTVDFIAAYVLELVERPGHPLCGVEKFIDGPYRKYNSNYGFVSEDERNTPQAFSHFTYVASLKQLIIVDIQGIDDVYTDPQIHTTNGSGFGKGNMGDRGFAKFLSTHRCNAMCTYLKLPPINPKQQTDGFNGMGTMPATRYIQSAHVTAEELTNLNSSVAFAHDTSIFATRQRKTIDQQPLLPPLPVDHEPPESKSFFCFCFCF